MSHQDTKVVTNFLYLITEMKIFSKFAQRIAFRIVLSFEQDTKIVILCSKFAEKLVVAI